MDQSEYEIAKHVATDCLQFRIDFDDDGHVFIEIGGQKWEFKSETDAQAIENVSKIFNQVNYCMWEVINDKITSWVCENKLNFN